MSKGRVLSIRLSNSQLMGIIDLLEIKLLQEPSLALSTNVVSVIDLVINNARKNGDIPFYDDERLAGELLAEKVKTVGKSIISKPRAQRAIGRTLGISPFITSNPSTSDFKPGDFAPTFETVQNLNPNFSTFDSFPSQQSSPMGTPFDELEDIFASTLVELQAQEEGDLMAKLSFVPLESSSIVLETAKLKQTMEEIPENDPKLLIDKFYNEIPEQLKKTLRIIYFNIPREDWSGDKARELLKNLL